MTERALYEQNIPLIAEIVVECRKLTQEEYENFKKNTIANAPETVRCFIKKVFIVIDDMLLKKKCKK